MNKLQDESKEDDCTSTAASFLQNESGRITRVILLVHCDLIKRLFLFFLFFSGTFEIKKMTLIDQGGGKLLILRKGWLVIEKQPKEGWLAIIGW